MKEKYIAVFIVLLMLTGMVSACTPSSKANTDSPPSPSTSSEAVTEAQATPESTKEPEEELRLILTEIPAPSLSNNMIEEKTEQGIGIYLPPDYYTGEKQYPVLYYLPGFGDHYLTFVNMFSESLDSLYADDSTKGMIVVSINGINKLGGSFYYNSPVIGNWEDFVTKDVVQYIDTNYRTIKDANARGLAGHSMGGFGVLNIAMHTKDIFNYAYSMSPGVFDETGLSKSAANFSLIDDINEKYKDMDTDTAKETYLKYIKGLSWPKNFTFAYGSAFAYDVDAKAPYIKNPQKGSNEEYMQDETWKLYDAGYGNVSEKLDMYKENLLNLKGFKIEYGTRDEFVFIPEGCEYLSEQLKARDIPHELITFSGDHQTLLNTRINDEVIPFFFEMFGNQ